MRLIFQRDVDGASGDVYFMRLAGLSTETKPTENVATGSIFIEVDTDKKYRYDEDSTSWTEEPAAIDPEAISEAVEDWLDDHPEATTTVVDGAITYAKLDSSLKGSVDDVSDLKNEIDAMNTATATDENKALVAKQVVDGKVTSWDFKVIDRADALTTEQKNAILNCFAHVAWTDNKGQDYYDDLYDAFFGDRTLSYITATYVNTNPVYPDTSLDSLKQYITCTAHYDDSTSEVVQSYSLLGTLTVGTSQLTVRFYDCDATINVTVVEKGKSDMTKWTDGIPYTDLDIIENSYYNNGTPAGYSGWGRTGYIPIHGASTIEFGTNSQSSDSNYNFFFDENKTKIGDAFKIGAYGGQVVNVPSGAYYFGLSWYRNPLSDVIECGITPFA